MKKVFEKKFIFCLQQKKWRYYVLEINGITERSIDSILLSSH